MTELPVMYTGTAEIVFCLAKYEIGKFMHVTISDRNTFDGGWQKLLSRVPSLTDKDRAINELERCVEKVLRYCDPQIPLHLLSTSMAKSFV
jgi:hypothetical protein